MRNKRMELKQSDDDVERTINNYKFWIWTSKEIIKKHEEEIAHEQRCLHETEEALDRYLKAKNLKR